MMTFQIGETVVVTHTTKKKTAGVWTAYNPATSITVAIYDSAGAISVAATPMTYDAVVGQYHYDFQTVGKAAGKKWRARVVDTDGARITYSDGVFALEA
jgi:hypothetical protein